MAKGKGQSTGAKKRRREFFRKTGDHGPERIGEVCRRKHIYYTRKAAKQAIARVRRTFSDPVSASIRPYRCPICDCWHLTRRPLDRREGS